MMRALILSLLLAGCAASPAGLTGTQWRMSGAGERPPTIAFDADGAGGFSGCNHWFGNVQASGEALHFTNVGGTEMACDEPAMSTEQRFYAMLGRVRSHRNEGGSLILLDAGGAELARFARTS